MPGVSYYQVLGIEPDASPEAIKAAWREATDKFEPGQGSGQFRLFNEAADVLLDPGRRAEYDEELGAEAGSASAATPRSEVTPRSGVMPRSGVTLTKPAADTADLPVTHRIVQATGSAPRRARKPRAAASGRGVPVWVIALLSVLTVAALALGGVFAYHDHQQGRTDDAGDQASAAADRALPVILSYDYRHLDADRDQAVRFMSPSYRREYTSTFDKLINTNSSGPGPAVQAKAVVRATVESVGVVSAETDRVQVIAFLNQTTVKDSATPKLALNRLTVSMVKSGNQWLVDNIVSY